MKSKKKKKNSVKTTTMTTEIQEATTIDDLKMAIKRACPVVRRVFGYYKSSRSMAKGDYIQFIQQSRVVSRRSEAGLQAADVELLWLKCSKQALALKNGKTPCLLPSQFMECILRISAIKYETSSPSVVDRLHRMCIDDLKWNARQSDVDALRCRLIESGVFVIFQQFKTLLKNIFNKFSKKGKMSRKQWSQLNGVLLLEEHSNRLSARHTENIFHKSQSGSVAAINTEVKNVDGTSIVPALSEDEISYEASVLDFTEFFECISVMSVYECPDPYQTLGMKIRRYIETVILPR